MSEENQKLLNNIEQLVSMLDSHLIEVKDGKVNAEGLHAFLEVQTKFTDWLPRLIEKYDFVDGQDFNSKMSKTNGRPKTEYLLTIDTAKEIAMVSNTVRGKQARRYFIETEKRLRSINTELSRKDILLMALETEERNERLQLENKAKDKVIEDQNILHGSLLQMKATESRTTLKALKDDAGVEINLYVNKLFATCEDYRKRHIMAHELYNRMTGRTYAGASKSSLESKQDYLWFLKEQVANLESTLDDKYATL